MTKPAALTALLLLTALVAACGEVHGVSSSTSTNVQGAPGTAGDAATGGQGNRSTGGGRL